jgi:hypothetical protein
MTQVGFLRVRVSFHGPIAASDIQQCDWTKLFLYTILFLFRPIFEVDLLHIDETWRCVWNYVKVKNIVNG